MLRTIAFPYPLGSIHSDCTVVGIYSVRPQSRL
jgi:hypothetical protein